MISEVVGEVFKSFGKLMLWTVSIILILICIIFYLGYNTSVDSEDSVYKTKKIIIPEIVIEIKTVNGIKHSDTTYIYKFSK